MSELEQVDCGQEEKPCWLCQSSEAIQGKCLFHRLEPLLGHARRMAVDLESAKQNRDEWEVRALAAEKELALRPSLPEQGVKEAAPKRYKILGLASVQEIGTDFIQPSHITKSEFILASDFDAMESKLKAQPQGVKEAVEALEEAIDWVTIGSDWNFTECEIKGEMIPWFTFRVKLHEAIQALRTQPVPTPAEEVKS